MSLLKPVLAIDCDGVLADWMMYVIPIVNNLFNKNITKKDLISWDLYDLLKEKSAKTKLYDYLNTTDMILHLEPFSEALEGIKKLKEIAEIYIVTSPMMNYPNWIIHRNEWLKKHFKIDKNNIVNTAAKYLIQADIFIDDKPENVVNWANYKNNSDFGYPVLWEHDYINVKLDERVIHTNNWGDIIELVNRVRNDQEIPF